MWIILLIVVLLFTFYWLIWRDDVLRADITRNINLSSGGFDGYAKAALEDLTRIRNPTAADYFQRGDLVLYHGLNGEMRRGPAAQRALNEVTRNYTNAMNAGLEQRVGRHEPEFMLHRMEEFGTNLAEQHMLLDGVMQLFVNTLEVKAPLLRQATVIDRRDRAINETSTRADAMQMALSSAIKYTSDAQNVHDGKVNADLRDTLSRLKATAGDADPSASIDAAAAYIDGDNKDALTTLALIRQKNYIGTFGESEDKIFSAVWERCSHTKNKKMKSLMRDAVITALADSVENGVPVCINGRCSRLLSSLVTLDYDDKVGGAMTFEAYRNQIFQDIKHIVDREICTMKESDSAVDQAVGAAYETGEECKHTDAETAFKTQLKREIDLDIDAYVDKLTAGEIATIKEECYIYATI